MIERWTVHYSGRVQGVGFRFRTREIARQFPVDGYVANLDDGRVRWVAEGEPEALDAFRNAIRSSLGKYIVADSLVSEPATREFSGFQIRILTDERSW